MECRSNWALANWALANWARTLLLACAWCSPSGLHAQPHAGSKSPVPGRPLSGQALVQSLDALLDGNPAARRTTITLKVVDLQSGAVLYDRGGDRLLTPASNLKIYTSACALDCFGPERHFPTRLVATSPIREGVLDGNLLLVGGGNAMLTSRELFDLADRVVQETKLSRVEGCFVVDNRRYDSRLKGPGWMWDDDPDYYNMPVTPLMVDFNVLTVRLTPAGQSPPRATLDPPASYPPILFQPREGPQNPYAITRQPFQHPIEVRGQGPLPRPLEKKLTMYDPGRWVAALMTRRFMKLGVKFVPPVANRAAGMKSSQQRNTRRSESRQWRLDGVSLAETLNHFHAVSENAVGEVLLHELAIAHGIRQPAWSDGARVISQWLIKTAGLEPGSFRLVDGSGLSRYNLISADASVKLLAFMNQHRYGKIFFDSLRVYPVDLAKIEWPEKPVAKFSPERVSAKSGGMTGVATISGYAQTLAGRSLAFSLLANGFLGSNQPLHELRSQVWRLLVRYSR